MRLSGRCMAGGLTAAAGRGCSSNSLQSTPSPSRSWFARTLAELDSESRTEEIADISGVIRERLLTFVLELADDRVTQDVSSWRRASVGLILQLFNTVMPATDPSPHNLVVWRGLLPAHLNAITLCFEDHLEFGSDEQRLTLLSQLLHLQTLIPAWPSTSPTSPQPYAC